MSRNVVILAAARTPIGDLMGQLSSLPAHVLGAAAIRAALARAPLAAEQVDEVVLGQTLQAGQGQGPARQAALGAGLPIACPAWSLNQLCGSGLAAVARGAERIRLGEAEIVVAGGQESMSRAPHAAFLRGGRKMGEIGLADLMLLDGLTDAFSGAAMGVTAEAVARRYAISREDQDAFALRSHQRAAAALAAGRFADEIIPVTVSGRHGETLAEHDEHIRPQVTAAALAALKPAFETGGTVTAGNASGINDAAAALVLMDEEAALHAGHAPLARIVAFAQAGVEPAVMGTGPIPAVRKLLARVGWRIGDLDLIESNEAFAAQALAVERELGFDPAITNVNGGAIALGHPIGASGARVLTSLVYELRRRGGGKGLATLCVGGGMGVAMAVEA